MKKIIEACIDRILEFDRKKRLNTLKPYGTRKPHSAL